MKTFAVLEDSIVINTIICDTLEAAENASGKTCIQYTIENPAVIGYPYINGYFFQPRAQSHEVFPPLNPGDEGYISSED